MDDEAEEDDDEEKQPSEGATEANDTKVEGTSVLYGWLSLIKEVSDLTKYNWGDVWRMSIYEFFSYVSFIRQYRTNEKKMIDQYRNRRTY